MKPVVFPTAVGVMVMAGWLAIGSVEQCLLPTADRKFDCWQSLQIFTVFAAIGAGFTTMAAALARGVLHRFLAFGSVVPELVSAALASIVLVLLFAGIIHWEFSFDLVGGTVFGWLLTSSVVCGVSLIVVKRFSRVPETTANQRERDGTEGATAQKGGAA